MRESNKERMEPENFDFIHCARCNRKGGGGANIYADHLSFKISFGIFSFFEYVAAVCQSLSIPYTACS